MKPRDISKARNPDLRTSQAALRRAAQLARETAVRTNTHLVVVRKGKVVKIPPAELRRSAPAAKAP